MAISSSSNRRLLVFQALFALFTLLMYRSLARGGVTSKLSPEHGGFVTVCGRQSAADGTVFRGAALLCKLV
jgi:hypothetical protein